MFLKINLTTPEMKGRFSNNFPSLDNLLIVVGIAKYTPLDVHNLVDGHV